MNSLGFDRAPADTRVVVAMSGGVDSSVAAAVLKEEGYDVVGITLQLYDQGVALGRKGACCAGQDIYDARRVAERLDMPHYVLDYESRFSQAVIGEFADSYLKGETPIPCVRCNQRVKFRDLLGQARELGAVALATGHYVRRVETGQGAALLRGSDPARDQSYFLFATTQEQLDYLRFPVGHLAKAETRAIAQRLDLPVADKPDSQDICFVPDGDYARVVRNLRPEAADPGEIVATDGTVLGRHEGIVNFTVGQRRGLNLGGGQGDPLYVVGVDAPTRRVTVGSRAALARDRVRVREVNWLGDAAAPGMAVEVKLRSAQPAVPGQLTLNLRGEGLVELPTPQFGVAPGQAAVFYQGDRLVGGGWIAGAELSAASAA